MNIGICIAGAACIVRNRVIIPAANRKRGDVDDDREPEEADQVDRDCPRPPSRSRARSAKTIAQTMIARTSAARPKPASTAERSPAARNSRRVKPESKSAPIEKPMKTPPKAADCSRTKMNWKAL